MWTIRDFYRDDRRQNQRRIDAQRRRRFPQFFDDDELYGGRRKKKTRRKKGGVHQFRVNQIISPEAGINYRILEIFHLPNEEMGEMMIIEHIATGDTIQVHCDVLWEAGWRPSYEIYNQSRTGAGRKKKTRKKRKKKRRKSLRK